LSTFWIYRYEDKKIFNESKAFLDSAQPYERTSTNSSITASIARNTTDYRLDPTTGMINNLSVEFAGIGGTNHYTRYIANTTYFHPVIWGSVFSLKGEFGYIRPYGGYRLPIDEKFYLGGINTLRGYSNRTVSPWIIGRTGERFYMGGAAETVYNAELTIPLLKDAGLKGVVFFDTGNSYRYGRDLFSSMQSSYGAGIRWFSPIGPLRLEYGFPLNPRTGIDSNSGRLEFSIGSFF
jgi:outer membrane protein insertion porin family